MAGIRLRLPHFLLKMLLFIKSIMDQFLKKHLFSRRLDENNIKKLHGDFFTPLVKLQFLQVKKLTFKTIHFNLKGY